MSEEIIGPSGVVTAIGLKLLYDVCGPSAKYLGGELASYTEAGCANLKRIFTKAGERIKELGKTEGQVPPRLLKDILTEGYFCEDELVAQYLGGVLASGKSPVSRDDRGVAHCALISSLSSYQLRTHYLLYSSILTFNLDQVAQILEWVRRGHGATVLIDAAKYNEAMDFSANEDPHQISEHAFIGLQQKGLSEEGIAVIDRFPKNHELHKEHFRFFRPTSSGVELFLWGLGVGDQGFTAYGPHLLTADLPTTITPLKFELGQVSYG